MRRPRPSLSDVLWEPALLEELGIGIWEAISASVIAGDVVLVLLLSTGRDLAEGEAAEASPHPLSEYLTALPRAALRTNESELDPHRQITFSGHSVPRDYYPERWVALDLSIAECFIAQRWEASPERRNAERVYRELE
jgi:hypothetical protein